MRDCVAGSMCVLVSLLGSVLEIERSGRVCCVAVDACMYVGWVGQRVSLCVVS